MNTQDFLTGYTRRFVDNKEEEMSLGDYLELCRTDPNAYANPAERLLMAIGEPEMIDTRHDPVLSRLFSNKIIPHYRVFDEFYGLEEPIEQIVGFVSLPGFLQSNDVTQHVRKTIPGVGAVRTSAHLEIQKQSPVPTQDGQTAHGAIRLKGPERGDLL